jgi:hypothetical protein
MTLWFSIDLLSYASAIWNSTDGCTRHRKFTAEVMTAAREILVSPNKGEDEKARNKRDSLGAKQTAVARQGIRGNTIKMKNE